MKTYQKDGYRKIFCKDETAAIDEIRKCLAEDGKVKIVNQYETFYGVGFDSWLRNTVLKDIDCNIEVTGWNKWENYPWNYNITLNK